VLLSRERAGQEKYNTTNYQHGTNDTERITTDRAADWLSGMPSPPRRPAVTNRHRLVAAPAVDNPQVGQPIDHNLTRRIDRPDRRDRAAN